MRASEVRDAIRTVLCKGLTPDQVEQLVAALVPMKSTAGHVVLREGDDPTGLVLMLSGAVEIVKQGADGSLQSIARLEAPTVLGELSLILERPHWATVQAVTDCEFYLLTRAQFARLLASDSIAAYKLVATIAEVLAQRLTRMDAKFLELSARREAAPHVEELESFKQKLFTEWSF